MLKITPQDFFKTPVQFSISMQKLFRKGLFSTLLPLEASTRCRLRLPIKSVTAYNCITSSIKCVTFCVTVTHFIRAFDVHSMKWEWISNKAVYRPNTYYSGASSSQLTLSAPSPSTEAPLVALFDTLATKRARMVAALAAANVDNLRPEVCSDVISSVVVDRRV